MVNWLKNSNYNKWRNRSGRHSGWFKIAHHQVAFSVEPFFLEFLRLYLIGSPIKFYLNLIRYSRQESQPCLLTCVHHHCEAWTSECKAVYIRAYGTSFYSPYYMLNFKSSESFYNAVFFKTAFIRFWHFSFSPTNWDFSTTSMDKPLSRISQHHLNGYVTIN